MGSDKAQSSEDVTKSTSEQEERLISAENRVANLRKELAEACREASVLRMQMHQYSRLQPLHTSSTGKLEK